MIQVLRVDDRLLHGQVAVAWTRHYKVDVILVANDHLITDKNMQVAFKLATPAGVTLSMKSLQGAVNVINNPKHASRRILVITKDLDDAKFVCEKTGTEKRYVQGWLPIVAAAQLAYKRPEEKDLLESWINVFEYQ